MKPAFEILAARWGAAFFAVAVATCGVVQVVTGKFVRLVPKLPDGLVAPEWTARLGGVLLVAAALAILTGGAWRRRGALAVAALLAACFLLLHVPNVAARPLTGFVWTNPLKALSLLGGALLIADWPRRPSADALWIARGALALFLVVGGLQHFAYASFVHQLVPAWMPGGSTWTYVTGVALIAGGLGLVIPQTAPWASRLSALMIFLWVPMLHIPRAVSSFGTPEFLGEMSGVCEALAVSGVALAISARLAYQSRPN